MVTAVIESYLLDSTSEVLESMCFTSVEHQLPGPDSVSSDTGWPALPVGRCLRFAGACTGWFGVQTDLETARLIAGNLLGEEGDELAEEQAGEAIGEIANMICGAMLAKMESKQAFRLSSPEAWPIESTPGQSDGTAQWPKKPAGKTEASSMQPGMGEVWSGMDTAEAIRCRFQLDCGFMVVWVEVQ